MRIALWAVFYFAIIVFGAYLIGLYLGEGDTAILLSIIWGGSIGIVFGLHTASIIFD